MLRRFLFLIAVLAIFFPGLPAQAGKDKQIVFGPVYCEIDGDGVHFSVHELDMDRRGKGVIVITNNTPQMKIKDGFIRLDKKLKSHKKHKDYKKQKGSISLGKYLGGHKNKSLEKKIDFKNAKYLTVYLKGTPKASITVEIRGKGSASSQNEPPVANAGSDQTVFVGHTVSLNGGGSNDVDGGSLSYQWSFSPALAGSTAALSDSSIVNPIFVPDIVGTYEVQLIVNDGTVDSASDTVVIAADTRMIVVPDVVGQIQAGAETALMDANLTVGTISTAYSNTGPADRVISQTPAAGHSIVEGSAVNLVVSLGPENQNPAAYISASPAIIQQGTSASLSWSSVNVQSAHIDQDLGIVGPNGSMPVSPDHTTTYTITVTGDSGSASAHVTVKVTGNPEPQPEGHFGARYEDLIPLDATVESYDPRRFALITGRVQDPAGSPITDVAITIHSHPEYGTATSDAEGQFSVPVEGGTAITVVYQKPGLITAHRQVYVPWNDTAIAETVVMIAEDEVATTITFDGKSDTVFAHQSSVVTDEFGPRSATMVFKGDNRAFLVDENGNDVQELTTITTRATEYTTPESMPAVLPPTSAYTYCVELGVDGAQRVRFENPVILWVDNFLGFDVGTAVPVGYYNRDRGVWVPEKNGRVVQLLDMNSDGVSDALDENGDGEPDDLNQNGSFSDELNGLGDAQKSQPDATFWRVAVNHFSPHDLNWARRIIASYTPLEPHGPEGAILPNPDGEVLVDEVNLEEPIRPPATDQCMNSYVENRSRIFHEDIAIPGTDMALHYAGNRVEGYHHGITVPASGATVPEGLKKIVVNIEVAGRKLKQILPPLPDQKADFVWDGLDHLGNRISGGVVAKVNIGFVYEAVYTVPPVLERAFAALGQDLTLIMTREEAVLWKRKEVDIPVPAFKDNSPIAEGWTLSSHHYVNPSDLSTLYKGDGSINANNSKIITTVAGNGHSGSSGDGGQATAASLKPFGISVDSAGNIFFVEKFSHLVRKVDTDGIITTVAGGGTYSGTSSNGGPATAAKFNKPTDVSVDSAGNIYICSPSDHRVWKVDTDGIITTVAGGGEWGGDIRDGGPATAAWLYSPDGVSVDSAGNVYIADTYHHRIRKVDTGGIITTVAGNGTKGFAGDGGAATDARLTFPTAVSVDRAGNIYFADAKNHRIRKVDTGGTITTVAGNGNKGSDGDGGLATAARLNHPTGLAVDSAGNVYIADSYANRIRKVDTGGIITTVAGNGTPFYSGEGGPATAAGIYAPYGVSVDSVGNIYISNIVRWRIHMVAPPSRFAGYLIIGDIPFSEENGLGHIMDHAGRHKKTIDLATGQPVYEFEYDQDKNLISVTDRFGNQTTIARDGNGVPTSITSPYGLTTTLNIDSDNHLTRISYQDGSSYGFEYTPDGLMTAEIEPKGNRFDHVFDALGRLTEVTDQENGSWNYTRTTAVDGEIRIEILTAEGNITTIQDRTDSTGAYFSSVTGPTGAETLFSQSGDGMTVYQDLPCGMQLESIYDLDSEYLFKYVKERTERTPSGLEKFTLRDKVYQDTNTDDIPDLITETVSVNGNTTTLVHDILQARKIVTSPEGRAVTSLYNPSTLLTESVSIPGLYNTTYGYDSRGRLISIFTYARQSTFAYNPEGFLESVTDPKNQTTRYTYDPVGRVTRITRPDKGFVGFTYDKNGNMTVLTKPVDVDHGFGFNSVNRNSSYQTPLNVSYSYIYDFDRRLTQTNFPSDKSIFNDYDNPDDPDDKSRLWQIETPEDNIYFTYMCGTKVGSITKVPKSPTKDTESITYGYDGKLVTSETLAGTLNQILTYTYNNDFDVSSLTYAGGTVSYSYDNDGLLTGAGSFTITRNANNGLPEAVNDDALNLDRTFNRYGEVDSQAMVISSNPVASWSLTRDKNGRITAKTETVGGVTSILTYTYDSMGRLLTVAKDGNLVEEYGYDLSGTRVFEKNMLRGFSGRTFTYSDEDHLLTADSISYEYDPDGFLITRTESYEYDPDGFLTKKTDGSDVTNYTYSSRGELLNVSLPDLRTIEYVHDPLGRRIAKKVNDVTVEKYLWQGLTRLLAFYDVSKNLQMRFEYADGRLPVAVKVGTDFYYLTYDQVGSLRAVADSAGTVKKSVEYDSFGNILNDSNPAFAIPFGFAGGLHDRDTGLVRFGYRDYDPDVGRWTAKDPILFAGGDTDLYGYVLNDPVNATDSEGLLSAGSLISIGVSVLQNVTFTKAGPHETAGKIVGGVVGGLLGTRFGSPLVGIAGGIIGSELLGYAGAKLDVPVKKSLDQMLAEDPEFRDAYYENDRFLSEIDNMLNDPIWNYWRAVEANTGCP